MIEYFLEKNPIFNSFIEWEKVGNIDNSFNQLLTNKINLLKKQSPEGVLMS